ncbi:MAG: N-6 DNA methylase [Nannocystaceae bacterium]
MHRGSASRITDGNFRFVLWESIREAVARARPARLSSPRVRRYLEKNRGLFLPYLDALEPYYVLPRPTLPTAQRARENANIAALWVVASGTKTASREERLALAKYTGFGGLDIESNVDKFPIGIEPEKYGLLHEYYTPYEIADEVVRVLEPFVAELADASGRIRALEPSAGIGRFLDAANRSLRSVSLVWTAVELSVPSSRICALLHPAADVHNESFEQFNGERTGRERWGLVLCNPPFGSSAATRTFADQDPDPEYDEPYDFAYFMRRSLDALEYQGIGVFIVQQSFLTSATNRKIREKLLLNHHLMAAFRLPSQDSSGKPVFPGQLTVVDVLFFRSRGGRLTAVPERDAYVVAGDYFKTHPDHVLGEEKTEGTWRYAVVADSSSARHHRAGRLRRVCCH